MSGSLRKFISRAPRYTLRPSDNRLMRFAHQEQKGISHTTQFVDISMTGLAFVIDREEAPFIYENIKIEIPLDGAETIAWWAKVIRVQEHAPQKWYAVKDKLVDQDAKVLVAVTFHDLPPGHVDRIKRSLEIKFREVSQEARAEYARNAAALWAQHSWQLVVYIGLAIATFAALWFLAQPDSHYGAKGAPWGERFTHGFFQNGKW